VVTTALLPFLLLTLRSHGCYHPRSPKQLRDTYEALAGLRAGLARGLLGGGGCERGGELLEAEVEANFDPLLAPINPGVYYQLCAGAALAAVTKSLEGGGGGGGEGGVVEGFAVLKEEM
jgi:hypothetical protein